MVKEVNLFGIKADKKLSNFNQLNFERLMNKRKIAKKSEQMNLNKP